MKAIRIYEERTGNKVIVKTIYSEADKFMAASKSGGGPDIILQPNDCTGQFLGDKNKPLIISLDKYVTKEKQDKFIKSIIDSCIVNGKIYGIPFNITNVALVYNKKLVKNPPKTTDELILLSRQLKKDKIVPLVYPNTNYYYHWSWITGFGGKPFENKKASFNSKAQQEAAKFVKGLQTEKIIPDHIEQDMAESMFANGKAAMMITGVWGLPKNSDKSDFYEVTNLPINSSTGKRGRPLVGGDAFMVSINSKKVKIAYEFIDFMTTPEIQKLMFESREFVPAIKSIYNDKKIKENDSYRIISGFMKQAEFGDPMPNDPELNFGVWQFGAVYLDEVLNTKRSVEVLGNEYQKKSDEALNIYYKK